MRNLPAIVAAAAGIVLSGMIVNLLLPYRSRIYAAVFIVLIALGFSPTWTLAGHDRRPHRTIR